MDFAGKLAAVAASALLFFSGTGLDPVPVLAWLAPLPVFLIAPSLSGWQAAGAGFAACFLGSTNTWYWSAGSHDLPLWPWGAVVTVCFGLTFAASVALYRALFASPLLAAVGAAALWTAVLHVVSVSNPMGITGTLATTQADVPVVLQLASVTGAWGVEFVLMLVPAAIAAVKVRPAVVAAVALAVTLGGGALRLAGSDEETQRIALVASNQKGWAADLREDTSLLDDYLGQLDALPDGVKTVVLPEAAFGSDEARPAVLVEPMRRLAAARGFDIVVGYAHWSGQAKFNYALVFPAGGGEPQAYLKHNDTVSPTGRDLVVTPGGAGVLICLDINFRDPSQDYAAGGTRLLAIPASDEDLNGWQHSRTAVLRGVENGQAVAWGGRQTMLTLADGHGRIIGERPTGNADGFTTVVADVPLGPGATVYTRFGDWFGWLCVGLTVLALGKAFRLRKYRESPSAHPAASS
ncbi:nitrilase-related carbon-nitrogen hydrolase [Amycolatopsis sp. 195334CR]|uniref:nitrilase-related carbon-nitrogen hydrolase n=1 Tax=Amycolatopsis sp. 195334CR TaxID=2814588 RepID=UPI001A8D41AC|nr:nitrilase-related carbon-nitrogen hydrolase [Amycolatopsis sp. 195334CR]MBN6036880.1 acyltransferase [Amycolatopsis sp. 195334CR]